MPDEHFKPKVFISYAHEDQYFVDTLIKEMREKGIFGWQDSREIRAGKDWREAIDRAIKQSFALIAVMSPDAKQSEYVIYEWSFALGSEIEVIPVMVRKTELPARLQSTEYLDFTHQKHRPWDDLYEALKDAQAKKRSTPSLLDYLIGHLNSEATDKERAAVLLAMANLEDSRAIPSVVAALQDARQKVRSAAVEAITKIGKPAIPKLFTLLQDKENAVIFDGRQTGRINALLALARINAEETIPTIIETLNDENPIIRGIAADILGEMKAENAVPALIRLLEDTEKLLWLYGKTDKRVYHLAASSLLKIGTPEAKSAYSQMKLVPILKGAKWNELEWIEVGKVIHCFNRIGVAGITLYDDLKLGDQIIIVKDTAVLLNQEISSMRHEDRKINSATIGDTVGLKVDQKVKNGAEIYKLKQ